MKKFLRMVAGVSVATAVALSGTAVATAQSSLPAFSSSSSDPAPTQPPAQESNEQRLLDVIYDYDVKQGHIPNAQAEKKAEDLIDQALAGELWYADNQYEIYGASHYGAVIRIPAPYIEALFYEFEQVNPTRPQVNAPFGVAVGSDADYYYMAEVFLF